ncbi:hypothetical protein Hamer_G025297, partial [Homarus americanus]
AAEVVDLAAAVITAVVADLEAVVDLAAAVITAVVADLEAVVDLAAAVITAVVADLEAVVDLAAAVITAVVADLEAVVDLAAAVITAVVVVAAAAEVASEHNYRGPIIIPSPGLYLLYIPEFQVHPGRSLIPVFTLQVLGGKGDHHLHHQQIKMLSHYMFV